MDMPEDLVTLEQIRDRFYRALTPDEERVVPAWINDAWEELTDLPQLALPERLSADPPEDGLLRRVASVIRAAILRRLRNPQMRTQYSYGVDDASMSESLARDDLETGWFTAGELDRLMPPGAPGDSFTIRTDAALPGPVHPLTAPTDEWYPWYPAKRWRL